MTLVVFRSRLRPDADLSALELEGRRMSELAAAMPGYRFHKDFAAPDGEYLTLVEFCDEVSLMAWRNHPEHRASQERARHEFFAEYDIAVCETRRTYRFNAELGRVELSSEAQSE